MNTTISISHKLRDEMKEFGHKGETYNEIIERLLDSAKKRQIHDILMDETNTMTLKEARRRING